MSQSLAGKVALVTGASSGIGAAAAVAMAAAGARATAERPLAWIALEANRTLLNHGLMVRHWPGGGEETLLAAAHAHGAWLEWLA